MGREATKAAGNVWFEARKEAAKYNDKLLSREGAAEMLGMSVSCVADAELGLSKCMPVDKAVLMADLYRSPQLLNYYCINECPIGHRHSISDSVESIERLTVKFIKRTNIEELKKIKDKLIDIAQDGEISDNELPEMMEVISYVNNLSSIISEIKIAAETAIQKAKVDS